MKLLHVQPETMLPELLGVIDELEPHWIFPGWKDLGELEHQPQTFFLSERFVECVDSRDRLLDFIFEISLHKKIKYIK